MSGGYGYVSGLFYNIERIISEHEWRTITDGVGGGRGGGELFVVYILLTYMAILVEVEREYKQN